MRILVVTQYFWPENFKINDFALGMTELGHVLTVLTGKPNYPSGKFNKGYSFFNKRVEYYHGIKVIRVPLFPRGNGGGARLMINYISFAFFASIAAFFRVQEKFDLIFVYEPSPISVGIPAIVLKKKFKIPIFFWVLDLWPDSVEIAGNVKNRHILKLLNKLVIYIYKHSDRIFISSRSFSDPVREKNVDLDKIVYFPNWPEEIYLSEVKDYDKYAKIMPVGFKIMFAGNIGDSQDFESIISAANILRENREIHWIILGDGRRKQWLEAEVCRLNLNSNFHILGSYPTWEMPNFFFHCDAMLVTLKKSEIFSLTVPAKIQSYLAFGKPILAMLNGEGAEIIEEARAGISCNAGDYIQLANNIKLLLNYKREQLDDMGKNAKKYSNENFNRSSLFSKFEQVYAQIRSESRTPPL
jgi:glycosyltransferase involved in cell wall biosynthesis